MNTLKVQADILKATLTPGQQVKFCTDEDHVFVTLDQVTGYILPKEELRVDLKNAQVVAGILEPIRDTVRPDYKLVGTDTYRDKGNARKYVYADPALATVYEPVYVDRAKLKYFDNPMLYKAPNKYAAIISVTEQTESGPEVVVGCTVPVRIKEE